MWPDLFTPEPEPAPRRTPPMGEYLLLAIMMIVSGGLLMFATLLLQGTE